VAENPITGFQSILFEAQRQILANGKNIDAILRILAQTSCDLFDVKGLAVIFYDQSSQITRIRFNDGFEEHILNEYCIYFTKNKADKAVFERSMLEQCGSNNYFVPLGKKEEPFGAILLKPINESLYPIGDSFIELAATALGTFLELELVHLRMEEMNALLEVGRVVSSTLDLKELLTKIMSTATKVMRCETSTVYLVDQSSNELYFHIVSGDSNISAKLQEIRLPMGTGLAGWCAQNNAPVIVPDTSKDPRFFKGADKKSGFVTRSMLCVPMCHKDTVVGVLQVLNRTGDIPFNDHDLETLVNVANQAVSAIENARLYENIQKIYLSTIEVLATAIDAKDPYTQGHSRRVTQYSVAIAEQMGLAQTEIENIRYAGLLHDVGKIGIKDSIIRKPGRLTDEEYAIIKMHPSIGARILRPVDFLADKIPGVLHHHEYYDGRGYPDHLIGTDIPLAGRIICVADAFDAMTTNRPYRKGLSVNTVIAELKKFSGKQFDPECVQAFLNAFDEKISQYFEPTDDGADMVLIDDETGKEAPEDEMITEGTPSSQPYPPMAHPDEEKKTDSQPFPPIKC
jgi:HD-GYP domain-containing protein (c-di-GMP phosphodiesterase class II)